MPEGKDNELARLARLAGQAMFIPIFLVLYPLAFYWIGKQLDLWWGTGTWLAKIFLLLGLFSGARQVVMLIKRIMSDLS